MVSHTITRHPTENVCRNFCRQVRELLIGPATFGLKSTMTEYHWLSLSAVHCLAFQEEQGLRLLEAEHYAAELFGLEQMHLVSY
jgi:hypothetical protein